MFQRLLEIPADFFIVSEWKKQTSEKTRRLIHSRRRHFHTTKRSLAQLPHLLRRPGERRTMCLSTSRRRRRSANSARPSKELEINGNYFGEFSLTVVIYDEELAKVEAASADFYKVFSIADAQLLEERTTC